MEAEEFALELYAIVKELTTVNDYEFPYRIPPLRARADRLKEHIDELLQEFQEPDA